jgi:hypothetical protein
MELEKRRERQNGTMSYSLIGFPKPGDKKTDDAERAEDVEDGQDK